MAGWTEISAAKGVKKYTGPKGGEKDALLPLQSIIFSIILWHPFPKCMHRTYTHYNTTAFSTPHSERSFGSTYTPADSLHSAPEQVPSTPSKQLEKNKTKEPLQDNLRGSWEEVALYQRFEAVRKVSPIFLVEIAILSFLVWRQPRKPCQWWFTETITEHQPTSTLRQAHRGVALLECADGYLFSWQWGNG